MFTGRGNAGGCAVTLYMWEGLRGSNGACSTLCWISVISPATHKQSGPSGADSQVGGWACAHPRPLWVSPTTSPVRLGVSPAAASTPTGVFSQRLEALFPWADALNCVVCFAPQLFLLVYLCKNVGLPAPLAAVSPSASHCLAVSPLCWAAHLRPSY